MKTQTQHEPGRVLDVLVAKQVMGELVGGEDICVYSNGQWTHIPIPAYSTDIAAAWEVVERVGLFGQGRNLSQSGPNEWSILDCEHITHTLAMGTLAIGTSAPHAICLAALALSATD